MSERLVPTSPNWYCSKCSDSNETGSFVFAAKRKIYVYYVSAIDGGLSYKTAFTDHTERVGALSMCHGGQKTSLCCSGSDDGNVKMWDVKTLGVVTEHQKHMSKIMGISWSPVNADRVISGDEGGVVVMWDTALERHDVMCPEKGVTIFCVACSTQDADIVAIGYQTGLILLVNVAEKGQVVHRLRGHDEEVHSLTWSTLPGEGKPGDEEDSIESTSGCFLASGSKDQSVVLWSTYRGKSLCRLRLPTNSRVKRDKYDPQNRSRVWVTTKWLPGRKYQLVSSSFNGDMLLWDLERKGKEKYVHFQPSSTARGHQRIVFNVSAGCYGNSCLITTSLDRHVVVWDVNSLRAISSLPTVGGFIYSISTSPLEPGRIAFGVGDNMIRVWNTGSHGNQYDATTYWQGIRSKVTALAWHPTKENWLAFGTEDGRVGIYDIHSGKPPILANTYHKRTVYVVAWGPSHLDDKPALYSVGDGVVFMFDPFSLVADPIHVNDLITIAGYSIADKFPIRSEIAWSPDQSYVAIGNDNGSVEIYRTKTWQLVVVVRVLSKLVNVIRWHPPTTVASPTSSQYANWIAVGSNESVVQIVDLSLALESTEPQTPAIISESTRRLTGHRDRITCLAWSPHSDGKLVSVSYDYYAQVWDVSTGQSLANFAGHKSRIFSVAWSFLDEDKIFTGGEDSLSEWSIAAYKDCTFGEALTNGGPYGGDVKKRKKKKVVYKFKNADSAEQTLSGAVAQINTHNEALRNANTAKIEEKREEIGEKNEEKVEVKIEVKSEKEESTETQSEVVNDLLAQLEAKRRTVLLTSAGKVVGECATSSVETQTSEDFSDIKEKQKRRRKSTKTMFPVFAEMNNRNRQLIYTDVLALANKIYGDDQNVDNDGIHLGIYLNRRSAFKFIRQEGEYHLENENMDYYLQMEVWKGNIGGAIKCAKENDQLSDWLVAITPIASQGLWKQVSYDYARQLENDGQYHKAAIYLIAAERVYEAIDMFMRHKLFKEAVILAKVRLSPFDPLLEELYRAWAIQLTKDGQYEHAAKCYLSIKKSKDACRVLAQRSDEMSLRSATCVSFAAQEKREGWIYAQKLVAGYMVGCEWGKVYDMIRQEPNMQVFGLLACTHELLIQQLHSLCPTQKLTHDDVKHTDWSSLDGDTVLPDFMLDETATDRINLWPPNLVTKHTLPHLILRVWHQRHKVPMDTQTVRGWYEVLGEIRRNRQAQLHVQQMLVHTSYDLTLSLLALLLSETTSAIAHMNVLLSDLTTSPHLDLSVAVCQLLLPQGPGYMLKLQHEVTALRVIISMESNGSSLNQPSSLQTSTKFWSEPKDGDDVSNSSSRCKDLDCLRVYYYATVLRYVKHLADGEKESVVDSGGDGGMGTPNKHSSDHAIIDNADNGVEQSHEIDQTGDANISNSGSSSTENTGNSCSSKIEADVVKNRMNKSIPDVIPSIEQKCEPGISGVIETNTKGEITPKCLLKSPHVELPKDIRDKLSLQNLGHISRCMLWDIQARHSALKETLGYVHQALAQIMLEQPRISARSVNLVDSLAAEQSEMVNADLGNEILSPSADNQSNSVASNNAKSTTHCADIFNLCDYKPQNQFKTSENSITSDKTDVKAENGFVARRNSSELKLHENSVLSQRKPRVNKPSITFEQTTISDNLESTNLSKSPQLSSSASRRRHVLWTDESTGSHTCTRDYPEIPPDWMDVAIEERYSQSYMSVEILQEKEGFINGELRNGSDFVQTTFPSGLQSCRELIEVARLLTDLTNKERDGFVDRLCTWALHFAVNSRDIAYFSDIQKSIN